MSTRLDNLSLSQNNNPISLLDSRKTMCDYNSCSVLGGSVKCCLYDSFAADVDCARGFVKDEDCGTADDGPRDGDALALTARQFDTDFADGGVVAL